MIEGDPAEVSHEGQFSLALDLLEDPPRDSTRGIAVAEILIESSAFLVCLYICLFVYVVVFACFVVHFCSLDGMFVLWFVKRVFFMSSKFSFYYNLFFIFCF